MHASGKDGGRPARCLPRKWRGGRNKDGDTGVGRADARRSCPSGELDSPHRKVDIVRSTLLYIYHKCVYYIPTIYYCELITAHYTICIYYIVTSAYTISTTSTSVYTTVHAWLRYMYCILIHSIDDLSIYASSSRAPSNAPPKRNGTITVRVRMMVPTYIQYRTRQL